MKKIIFTLLLSSSLILTACNSKNEKALSGNSSVSLKSASSQSKASSTTSISETFTSSSSITIAEQSELLEESQSSVDTNSMTQEQALQRILETYPESNNEATSLIFWQMIDNDFLFKAVSKSIASQGGSGTLGFFRVSPQGEVIQTDSSGNPF